MEDQAQESASHLKRLAEARFGKGTLSDAEKLLLERVPTGKLATCPSYADADNDPKDANKRKIRAELVGWLCTDQEAQKHVHWRGIQVSGADVTGTLDLSFANIPFQLSFRNCRLEEAINLERADVPELDLRDSLVRGIAAHGLNVKHNVYLRRCAVFGDVGLKGAQIGADLDCTAGTFNNPPQKDIPKSGLALNADGIDVKGHVYLRRSTAYGEVRLLGAQIGRDLDCDDGTFTNPLQKDLTESGLALNADGIDVQGYVFLRGSTASGEVRLLHARIGRNLECDAGTFTNPPQNDIPGSGTALEADRVDVKGSVFLRDGFNAHGAVNLHGAQIGGTFVCRNANFHEAKLRLTDASAGSLVDSGLNDTGSDGDFGPTIWPQPGQFYLDGFDYGRISSAGEIDFKKRLEWLGRQPESPFRQQPYLHLARILNDSGDSHGALRVREKMAELRRRGEEPGALGRLWSLFLKRSIGYGYFPGRAIWLIILLTVLGWIVYGRSDHAGKMVPTDGDACREFKASRPLPPHYPPFSPLIYSVENSLPLVKLGQADKWQPDPGTQSRLVLPNHWLHAVESSSPATWFLRIQILLGWLLATLFVAGVSGIVHRE